LPVLSGIPEPKARDITLAAYAEWVADNFRSFAKTHGLERIRKQVTRQPVQQRFRLV
jgi:hypothetical protein